MKIDSVHAEFMSGNAVSSTTSSHSIVSRDASGDIHAAGVLIAGNSGTLFSYSDGTRNVYGGCNASDPWFGTSTNHDLRLVTYSGERMRIDKTGKVGIGTSSPDDDLHIYSTESQGTQLKIQNAKTTGDTRAGLFLQTRSSNVFSMQFTPSSETAIFDNKGQGGYAFYQKNSSGTTNNVMQITEDGNVGIGSNVGIGTSSPIGKLDVRGAIIAPVVAYSSNQDAPYLVAGTTAYNGDPNNTENWNLHGIEHRIKVDNGGVPRITVDMPSGGEVFSVVNGGNIGIGTSSPKTLTHIGKLSANSGTHTTIPESNMGVSASFPDSTHLWLGNHSSAEDEDYWGMALGTLYNGNSYIQNVDKSINDPIVYYNLLLQPNGGNVGIGLTSPNTKLHVNGAIHLEGETISGDAIVNSDNRTNTYIKFGLAGTGSDWAYLRQIGGNNAMKMALDFHDDSDDCEFLIRGVHSSGNDPDVITNRFSVINDKVGIGTDDPHGTLHIGPKDSDHIYLASANNRYGWKLDTLDYGGGDVPFRLIRRTDGSDSTVLTVKNQDGNVGIGTSPSYKLDVNGPTRVGNVLYVGKNTNDSTSKTIYFGGTYGDNAYDHAVIERRVWSTGTEKQELLLFCGNDPETSAGPDRIRLKGAQILFDVLNNSTDRTSTNTKMIIKANGNVGIGTTSPMSKLHVHGDSGSFYSDPWESKNSFVMSYSGGPTSGSGNPGSTSYTQNYFYFDVGIYANKSILSGDWIGSFNGFISSSDKRIKKNIVDADDAECLETLRLLKPKKYQYRDVFNRGEEPVWGFIAQEVRETLPHATQLRREVLPNIYELANVSQSNVITFTNFNTSNLESNATTLIRVMGIDSEDHDIHLVEVIDEHTIRVEEDLTEWIGSVDETGNVVAGNQLFVRGQEVDDFVYLKKESIFTVATAALQEVDRQLQAEKSRNDTLESRVTELEGRNDALESRNDALESRLTELEGMVSLIKHNMTWPDE